MLTSFLRKAALKMSAGATCALSPKITTLASDGSSYVAHIPVMRRSGGQAHHAAYTLRCPERGGRPGRL